MLACPYNVIKIQTYKKDGITPSKIVTHYVGPTNLDDFLTKPNIIDIQVCPGNLLVNMYHDEWNIITIQWLCSKYKHEVEYCDYSYIQPLPFLQNNNSSLAFLEELNVFVNFHLGLIEK
jgi:hypothetical protein